MKHPIIFALAVCFAAGASAAAQPACLAGPVTQGNVTLNCTWIDEGGTSQETSFDTLANSYGLAVVVTSSSLDVLAVRIAVTYQIPPYSPTDQPHVNTFTRIIGKAQRATPDFRYTFTYGGGAVDSKGVPLVPVVTSITVQELVAASSQTF